MMVYMHAQSFSFIKNAQACMCVIFLTNSSPSHCRLTITNNIFFFISYIRNVKTVNTFISHINDCVIHSQIGVR